jgi:serine/threonine protein kinase
MKKLNHENIIALHHIVKERNKLYIIMENGGKQSLSGLLRKNKCFK